jgi:ADP-L-glycero-D-manno-heptose 6-epimerase
MNILLTGGTGFIGFNLAKKILELNNNLTITGVKTENQFNMDCKFLHLGLGSIDNYLKNKDCVFHLAANNDTLDYDKEEMFRNNLYDPIELFHKAYEYGCRKFIYASSTAVYGNQNGPFTEETTPNPLNCYAESKLLFDEFAKKFEIEKGDVSIIGLRYCNVYGPNECHKNKRSSMIFQLYNKIKNNEKPKLFKYGEQKRDWCYIKDVVEANLKCLDYKGSGIFNIANGNSVTFNELVNIINNKLNKKIEIEYIDCNFLERLQTNTECDVSKAKNLLGWIPKYNMKSGIEDYIDELFLRSSF